jgi:hypothetical protein
MAVPPDFVAGQILTAAQMNAVGLWEIKSQVIGTAVSSVEVTGAFSADYDNYIILVNGGFASTTLNLNLTLGSTTTGYYAFGYFGSYTSGAVTGSNINNAASWSAAGTGTASNNYANIFLSNPFLAKNTMFLSNAANASTTSTTVHYNGFLNNSTSYTSFTLTTSTGTVTGGTIRVYGYRN